MTREQLAKLRADETLYRVRWFGYGRGVALALDRFDGEKWHTIEEVDKGTGAPKPDQRDMWVTEMEEQIRLYEGDASVEPVQIEGRKEIRK